MNTKIGLYFQLEMNDPKDTFALMKLAVNRLEQLENEGVDVEHLELRLSESSSLQIKKQVYIKLDGSGRTFIDSETSSRWDDAFITAFDRIEDQFRSLNPRVMRQPLREFQIFNAMNVVH